MRPYSLVLLLALAGCVPAPVVQSPAELKGTHGFVHVGLPGAGARPVVQLRSKDGQEYRLARQEQNGPYAYGLWLPPGEYDVVDMTARDGGKYPTVSVSQGRLTDMGGLVRMEVGGYEHVVLPIRHADLAAATREAAEALKAHLRSTEPIEWRPTVPPLAMKQGTAPTNLGLIADLIMEYDRHVNKPPLNAQLKQAKTIDEFYRGAVAAMPPLTEEPGADAAGNLYYGAELGQIRVRTRDGQWSSIDTGTIRAITAVEVSGAMLVAGTAGGELRVSSDRKTWRRVAALAPEEPIVDVDRVGNRWVVLTARLQVNYAPAIPGGVYYTADLLKVYSGTGDDPGGVALLREIPLTDKVFIGSNSVGLRAQSAGNFYYVSSVAELLKLDLTTLQWSAAANPGHGISGFNIAPKTGVLTAYRQQGVFSKLNVSTDQGASWRPADTPPYVFYDIVFETPQKGQATRWSAGAFSATIEFMEYDPAENKWRKTYEAPGGCRRLLRDADNLQRFCLTSGNSILNYVDGKWVVEAAVN